MLPDTLTNTYLALPKSKDGEKGGPNIYFYFIILFSNYLISRSGVTSR